jgi:arylsulfatase
MVEFDKTIMKFPNTRRFVGGASNDLVPNLQNPDNPVPLLKDQMEHGGEPHAVGGGG